MRIVISGTVGVGKSTTAKNIADYLASNKSREVKLIDELVGHNSYLHLFYENRPEWSFLIQMDFLFNRYKTLVKENERLSKYPESVSVFDRHFLDDMIFASMTSMEDDMSHFQFNQYKTSNLEMAKRVQPEEQPDFFILLKASFKTIVNRIKKRGRLSEQEVDIEYWRDMYQQYYENPMIQSYLKENTKKLILINIEDMDEFQVRDKVLKAMNLI